MTAVDLSYNIAAFTVAVISDDVIFVDDAFNKLEDNDIKRNRDESVYIMK